MSAAVINRDLSCECTTYEDDNRGSVDMLATIGAISLIIARRL